ncbi:MAG: hypothetical protein QXV63_02130 [Candidatus Aenigmatarchaeota archaeon]
MVRELTSINIKKETKEKLLEIKAKLIQNEKKNVTWNDIINYLLEKCQEK